MESFVPANKCLRRVLDSRSLEADGLAMTDEGLGLTGAREWSTFASFRYKEASSLRSLLRVETKVICIAT